LALDIKKVSIGEIFPFENKDEGFSGDSVREAFDKYNQNFDAISSQIGGGSGTGTNISDSYIDANTDYTQFFNGESLLDWSVSNGTLTIDNSTSEAIWTANSNSYIYRKSTAINGKRFTHFVIEIVRVSGGAVPNQRVTTFSPNHDFNFSVNYAQPIGNPVSILVGDTTILVFPLSDIQDWTAGTTTGLACKLSNSAGSYRIKSIRLVGPDSSFVQQASIAAGNAATQAELAQTLAEASAQLSDIRATAANDAKNLAEQFKDQSNDFANQAQGFAIDASTYSEKSNFSELMSTAASRFALYQQINPNANWDFSDGGIHGWTGVNATLTNSGSTLKVTHTDLDGQIFSPVSLSSSGVIYTKVVIKVHVETGVVPDFTQCRLFYTTTSRQAFNADYYISPIGFEKLTLNENNNVYLMFDADTPGSPQSDWETSTIRQLRFDLANQNPLVYDIDYIYLLGTDSAFPYKQAQAAATSAQNAGTSETAAQQFAQASQTFATAAQTSESNALTSANQASVSETNAQGAATTATTASLAAAQSESNASNSSGQAQSYATQAASSASSAEGSSVAASQSATVAARVSQGIPVSLNPVFNNWPTSGLPYGGQLLPGTNLVNIVKNTANAIYSPYALQFNIPSSSDFGVEFNSSSTQTSVQLVDVEYYVAEIDMALVAGDGAATGIEIAKIFSDTTSVVTTIPFSSFTKFSSNRYQYSGLVPLSTPTGKTISTIRIRIYGNNATIGTGIAKTIIWHKVNIRSASSSEIVANKVNGEVYALVQQEADARIAADGSISSKYTVKIDNNGYISGYGLIATENNGVPTSEMSFLVDKFKVVSPGAGGTAGTPTQMFSVGSVNGITSMVLNGNLIADGAISSRSLLVGIGGNLIDNADFSASLNYYSMYQQGTSHTLTLDNSSVYSIPQGSLRLYGNTASTTDFANCLMMDSSGNFKSYSITPGKRYEFSVYLFGLRCKGGPRIQWFDSTGTLISEATSNDYTFGSPASPARLISAYQRVGIFATAPANATSAKIFIQKGPTLSGTDSYLWIARPLFSEALANQTEFSTWQPGGATSIQGGSIVTGSIAADRLNVTNLSAISANLGSITAGSINVNNKFIMGTDGSIVIRSSTTGQRLEITSSLIRVFDGNNVERVRLGIW
jgi:multidrug efflux pump subunit AcrA (membrane-fusion protein)